MKSRTLQLFSFPILLSTFVGAATTGCDHVRAGDKSYHFNKIGGPHSVTVTDLTKPPSEVNTTWTIDICQPLVKHKGIPDADQCPMGTNVCGIVKSRNPNDDPDAILLEHVIPVAGTFTLSTGKPSEPVWSKIKSSDSKADGVQLDFGGGQYGGKNQKAVIRFICDESKTGNEGNDKLKKEKKIHDNDKRDEDEEESENSLSFVSYETVTGKDTYDLLRLDWRTKYACEDFTEDEGSSSSGGWGFFTWFILIAFLATAAYLIFGSWLNYNRYGARGWDLLPHGDTIRELPYIVKDWSRKVADTVSGGGSRGGYSAV